MSIKHLDVLDQLDLSDYVTGQIGTYMYDANDPSTWTAVPNPSDPAVAPADPAIIWKALDGSIFSSGTGAYDPPWLTSPEGATKTEEPAIPLHCGQEAKWVNNGVGFRYFFCSQCKEEVNHSKNDSKSA